METHPVQKPGCRGEKARAPIAVTMAAYEVYCTLYGAQEAMVTGDCRGGFSTAELIAFLYARAFPRDQWREKVDEAFAGMERL
jgi:hypothetical protein